MFPTPVGYDLAISKAEVAGEVLRVMYGQAKEAPGLKALNNLSLPSLAGDAAQEVGANIKRIATDAAFAMGFSVGTSEGVYDAVRDMVGAVGDAARLAADLGKAFLSGGFLGMTIEALDKLDSAAHDMAAAIALFGPELARRWNEGSSYEQGHFRGEVVGYVLAQIAILVVTSGESAVAQAGGKWATVVKALRTLNAMGDITEWAGLLERRLPHLGHPHPGNSHPGKPEGRAPEPGGHSGIGGEHREPHSKPDEPTPHDTDAASHAVDTPSTATQPWETGAEPGLPPTPQTIRDGRCIMEQHPGYASIISEAESKGFTLVYDHKARVANIRVVNPAGEVLEWRRELHVIKGMRYSDLEHELGHIHQLERFSEANRPATETLVKNADGTVEVAEGDLRRGTLDRKLDNISEYHNRLEEWIRFAERGAPADFLRQEADSVYQWRKAAERAGLGHGGTNHLWAQQYFPEIPALERRVRELGGDIGRSNKRWEISP